MLTGLASAIRLMTIIPLGNWRAQSFSAGGALPFFPLIGALVGGVVGGAYWLGLHGISPLVAAALALAADALITGAFHYDGLADTADGLWAQHRRERALEIMKDSRVGAHGVCAVVLVLVARLSLMATVDGRMVTSIVAAAVAARCAAVWAAVVAPYARPQGTGQSVAAEGRWWHVAIATAVCLPLCYVIAREAGLVGAAVVALFAALFIWRVSRRLGGMTGDTYGALIVLGETVALAAMLAARHLNYV